MAVLAGIAAGDMVGGFTGRGSAVMAGHTGPEHGGVIDLGHRQPGGGAMAILTEVGAVEMLGVLAGGGGAVVAGHTTAADTGMVEDGR